MTKKQKSQQAKSEDSVQYGGKKAKSNYRNENNRKKKEASKHVTRMPATEKAKKQANCNNACNKESTKTSEQSVGMRASRKARKLDSKLQKSLVLRKEKDRKQRAKKKPRVNERK